MCPGCGGTCPGLQARHELQEGVRRHLGAAELPQPAERVAQLLRQLLELCLPMWRGGQGWEAGRLFGQSCKTFERQGSAEHSGTTRNDGGAGS